MTPNLPDKISPARPHVGARALLTLAAATAAAYIAVALLLVPVFVTPAQGAASAAAGSPLVPLWNKFCASINAQNVVLRELNESLHANHPDRVIDAGRLELYTQAIVESEKQTALLKAMRKAEFGKAGGESEGTRAPVESERHQATTAVAFVTDSP